VAGLFLFFLLYGVVQERIMTKPYGVDENGEGEKYKQFFFFFFFFFFVDVAFVSSFFSDVFFTESAFLVLNNRVVTMVIAFGLALYNGESTAPVAPLFGTTDIYVYHLSLILTTIYHQPMPVFR
jgi:hypothetical protein